MKVFKVHLKLTFLNSFDLYCKTILDIKKPIQICELVFIIEVFIRFNSQK